MEKLMVRLALIVFLLRSLQAATRTYNFNVEYLTINRLCRTSTILSVNKQFPGPTISVDEGDRLIIKVTNSVSPSISLHWHGVFQNRSGWFDGPSYVAQCPIKTGSSYTYNFTIQGQRGTLWWHAHTSWMRATVHGAFVIHPLARYPFGTFADEKVLILEQWWSSGILNIVKQVEATGGGGNLSDAFAINGLPGPLYGDCSAQDTTRISLDAGKTYLIRIINAALNNDLFFAVADHILTVVEADAVYLKPFTTSSIVISPGQSTNVLLTASQTSGRYYLAVRAYSSNQLIPFDKSTAAGFFEIGSDLSSTSSVPQLPDYFDTSFVNSYLSKFRGYTRINRPFPDTVDKELIITVGLNILDCPRGAAASSCAFNGIGRFAASMNNISNILPKTAILPAHYKNSTSVYTTDFPNRPADYDFTGKAVTNLNAVRGTRVIVVPYATRLQFILQGTSLVAAEDHPLHLHGFDFYVIGTGSGNYNSSMASSFNINDPPAHNTVRVPAKGWVAIRFVADNPGAWLFHCHLDLHTSWGLFTVLTVKDGHDTSQKLQPPPVDYPTCD